MPKTQFCNYAAFQKGHFLFDDSRQIRDSRITLRSSNKRQHYGGFSNEFPSCKVGTTSSEGGSGRRRMRLNVHGIVFSYKAVGEDTEGRYASTRVLCRLITEHRNTSIIGMGSSSKT
jgi:hypothetical protein